MERPSGGWTLARHRNSLASRGNHIVSARWALLCVAALACSAASGAPARAADGVASAPTSGIPLALDARLAGDAKQTRFVLDLDRSISFRAFTLSDPYRVVIDIPQVSFHLPEGTGAQGRGLVKAFRYGLVMPGGSRIVIDLAGPARIANSYVLDQANGQPPRLVLELEEVDPAAFVQSLEPVESRPAPKPVLAPSVLAATMPAPVAAPETKPAAVPAPETRSVTAAAPVAAAAPDTKPPAPNDTRPIVVIDPGHGGIDNGTQTDAETEKNLVLEFGLALRDRLDKAGKYHIVMTRTDDTFIPLGERVRIARTQGAALFVSIHADALPKGEGDAQGATIYTLSDKASDAEAQRLADAENRADAIAGVNLTEEPTDVADILIDLAQRETRNFSNKFAHVLMSEMKTTMRMHKHPLKSAGFKVLKNPDVPSVLVEIGYVSNKADLEHLVSESWRSKAVGSIAQAIDAFMGKRLANAASTR
jgi:N-acetylmuramoyl-L-alanine amidase